MSSEETLRAMYPTMAKQPAAGSPSPEWRAQQAFWKRIANWKPGAQPETAPTPIEYVRYPSMKPRP